MTGIFERLRRFVSRCAPRPDGVTETVGLHANVRVAVYDAATLRASIPDWDALPDEEKLTVADAHEPLRVTHHHNTTTVDLFEYLVDDLDPDQTADVDATHLAFGDGGSTPSSSNQGLNNEVYRTAITSSTDAGDTLETRTLLDTSEANGYTLREVGLVTASSGGLLLNHSLINDESKNDQKAFSVDVSLSAGPA